jgi:hypothetical protein
MKGYGAVGREFERLMNYCYYELNKHVAVIFHAKEEKEGDNTRLRILVEGQTKDNVWQPMDIGGFIQAYDREGRDRRIGFSNCEQYFAKGTHGVCGVHAVPELGQDSKNDFLTRLFADVNRHIADESEMYLKEEQAYKAAMSAAKEIIETIVSPESAGEAAARMAGISHMLTSQREAREMFKARIMELGLIYDRDNNIYKLAS